MEILSSRTILHPSDFARSRAFYEEVLGLRIYHEYGRGEGQGVVYFLGGGHLELSGSGPVSANTFARLWIQIPDARSEEERLRRLGVPIVRPAERMEWGLIELVIRDPDGFEILLVEVPSDHFLRRDL